MPLVFPASLNHWPPAGLRPVVVPQAQAEAVAGLRLWLMSLCPAHCSAADQKLAAPVPLTCELPVLMVVVGEERPVLMVVVVVLQVPSAVVVMVLVGQEQSAVVEAVVMTAAVGLSRPAGAQKPAPVP